MLVKRLPVAIALIPSIAVVIYYGGWLLYGVITLVFCIGIYEYWHMFKRGGYAPNLPVMLIGVLLILYGRVFFGFEHTGIILTVLIMTAMTAHIIAFQKGIKTAGVDFNITLVGMIYIGWLGAYIISLSQMEEGRWWLLVILPASSLADSGAYFIGRKWGKHKMAPNVSPKKSWEGYLGGVFFGAVLSGLFGAMWQLRSPALDFQKGMILGLVISILATLGDFGISMFKRQFDLKDTSNLFPGHGGILDRFDAYLWALPLGFYVITWLW